METSFKIISHFVKDKFRDFDKTEVHLNGSKCTTGHKLNFSFGYTTTFLPDSNKEISMILADLQNDFVFLACDDECTAKLICEYVKQAAQFDPLAVREGIINYFRENYRKNSDDIEPFPLSFETSN